MIRFYVDVLDGLEIVDSYMYDNQAEQIAKYNELIAQGENADKFESVWNS